ncbi:hypothetical protein C8R42DRAFT_717989 [Lentinula raphanica]|nr:hypothetical protein C8R42DRAFT_717989 [Lentinula raphanica]
MLLILMIVTAIAAPIESSTAKPNNRIKKAIKYHKKTAVTRTKTKTLQRYDVVVCRRNTSKHRSVYLGRKRPEESYSPMEVWTVGLKLSESVYSGWWGYRTKKTRSPPFKWTAVKSTQRRGLTGAKIIQDSIKIGSVSMPTSIKHSVVQAVNKKLLQHKSTELPSLIYNNHTLTFYWEELSRNPQVTGLDFTLDTWVNIFFTDMVKVEGSGAGFAVTEPWERELYAQIQNGELGIDDMLRLVKELSVENSVEPVWEKVVEKRHEELERTPVEHKIGVTRQTKVDGPIDTYKQTETVIESNEVWTVGLRPVAVRDSAGAKDIVLYGYRSQRDSSSQWGAVKAEGSFAGAPYLVQAETMDLGTATMSPLTEKAVLIAVDQAIKTNHYDELPNLLFADHVVMLLWEELNSRSKASPPEVTNLSFDLLNWRNLRNMMLLQLGSAAGFEITRDMKEEWEMYTDAIDKAQ